MNFIEITSAQNPTIKKLAKLSQSAKARKESGLIVLDGEHLCQEWGGNFEYLITANNYTGTNKFAATQTIQVPHSLMQKLSPTKTSSGILGFVKRPAAQLQDQYTGLILLLESVQDPGNIGTIIRTAAATGVDTIFMNAECADVWSPKVLRAGMGGHFKLNLVENFDLLSIKDVFQGALYGTFMNGENLFETKLPTHCGFILGNEGSGVSESLKNLCDHQISIPMTNNVESLNVAMATGLCCYEYLRKK